MLKRVQLLLHQEADFNGVGGHGGVEQQLDDPAFCLYAHPLGCNDEQVDVAAVRIETAHSQGAVQVDAGEVCLQQGLQVCAKCVYLCLHCRGAGCPTVLAHNDTVSPGHDNEFYRPPSVICCHAERSEASPCPSSQTLRCAQGDTPVLPVLVGKNHNQHSTASCLASSARCFASCCCIQRINRILTTTI